MDPLDGKLPIFKHQGQGLGASFAVSKSVPADVRRQFDAISYLVGFKNRFIGIGGLDHFDSLSDENNSFIYTIPFLLLIIYLIRRRLIAWNNSRTDLNTKSVDDIICIGAFNDLPAESR